MSGLFRSPPKPAPWEPTPPPSRPGGLGATVVALAVIIVALLATAVVRVAAKSGSSSSKAATGHGSPDTTTPASTATGVPATTLPSANAAPSIGLTPVSPLTVTPVTTAPVVARPLSLSPSIIAARIDPAIVDVDTRLAYQHAIAAGTGMVLTSDGVVLTNNHVINGATTIGAVSIGTGRAYPATVIGVDPSADVAVLQLVGASGLATVVEGTNAVFSGDGVVAVGNAGGVGGAPSVTSGTVEATDQSIIANDPAEGTSEQLQGLIATSAALQPGDSGGPLIDGSGQVIGMDTAASEASGAAPTVSFAIPIAKAVDIAEEIETGVAGDGIYFGLPAFLGVQVIPGSLAGRSGAAVTGVVVGGAADSVGITSGDLVVGVAGESIDSPAALTTMLRQFVPGDSTTVSWLDGTGASHSAQVTLGTGPAD